MMPSYCFPLRKSSNPYWLLPTLVLAIATLVSAVPAAAQQISKWPRLLEILGPKEQLGAWSVVPLHTVAEEDRMQAVHAVLLPDGKILIVSGSSLRLQPTPGPIPLGPVNTKSLEVTDNTAIFDPGVYHAGPPVPSTFTRIGSPHNPIDGKANDLFCSGHLHTPEGNVLFVSGTDQYDDPVRQKHWTGTVFANLYDWQTGEWKEGGQLKDGHWYPTLLPLADGRIAAISGWAANENHGMSTWLEFYDWTKPAASAWQAVDIETAANGPFSNQDSLDHYPRIHALQDGRFLITGDGSGGGAKELRRTYFMDIATADAAGSTPTVTFELAAERTSSRRIYSTAVVDPNSQHGDVLLLGGQLSTENALIGPQLAPRNRAEAVTAQMERFSPPTTDNPAGSWEVIPDILGDRQTDARSNHYATLLPTKQLLVMGGGMYRFFRPNFQPLLLTPDGAASGGYHRVALNPGTQPRLYHNTALLLPDGRIFVAGGNASYAIREEKDGEVDVRLDVNYRFEDMFPLGRFPIGPVDKGAYAISAEIYQMEFFYPPYLFSPGPRPVITSAPKTITYGTPHTLSVSDMTSTASLVLMKLGSATHGWDMGQRLADLEFTQDLASGEVTFEAPAADSRHLNPPAYYMMFYVNDVGYPSVAKIIQLKAAADGE